MSETILICGSRHWPLRDNDKLRDAVWALPRDAVVIHGAADGADTQAGHAARCVGIKVVEYPAAWQTHGRAAGPIRNQQMLDEGKPDRVLAFRVRGPSRGTDDMIRRARKAGLPVEVIEL